MKINFFCDFLDMGISEAAEPGGCSVCAYLLHTMNRG